MIKGPFGGKNFKWVSRSWAEASYVSLGTILVQRRSAHHVGPRKRRQMFERMIYAVALASLLGAAAVFGAGNAHSEHSMGEPTVQHGPVVSAGPTHQPHPVKHNVTIDDCRKPCTILCRYGKKSDGSCWVETCFIKPGLPPLCVPN